MGALEGTSQEVGDGESLNRPHSLKPSLVETHRMQTRIVLLVDLRREQEIGSTPHGCFFFAVRDLIAWASTLPYSMGYRTLRECVRRPGAHGQLVRIDAEVDARLEAAEIQRRVCAAGGPAVLFARVKGCRFPMVSNLFGTMERARFMFRDSLERVRRLVELKIDPTAALRRPLQLCRRCADGAGDAAAVGRPRRRDGERDDDLAVAAAGELAGRRRGVHHAAAGLHRGRARAGLAAVEPGHVPRAAFRRRSTSRIARSACTTRFTAGSACITRRRFARASRFA